MKWWTVSRSQVSARVGEHQPVFKWALHLLMVFLQGTGEERFLFVQILSFICIKVWKRFEEQISVAVCSLWGVWAISHPVYTAYSWGVGSHTCPPPCFYGNGFPSKAQNWSKHSAVGERPISSRSCQLLVTDSPAVRKVEVIWGNCSSCVFGLKEL